MLIKSIILVLALCLIGCSSSNHRVVPQQVQFEDAKLVEYSKDDVKIDFGSGYETDDVQFYINGKIVFDDTIASDFSTGFADDVVLTRTEPKLSGKIIVNGKVWKFTLDLNKGHFFCIHSFSDEIEINQSKVPFYYD